MIFYIFHEIFNGTESDHRDTDARWDLLSYLPARVHKRHGYEEREIGRMRGWRGEGMSICLSGCKWINGYIEGEIIHERMNKCKDNR